MGQVEILWRDRKRSSERKGPREINFNWYQTTWQQEWTTSTQQNSAQDCCVLFNKTCILASTTTCTKLTKCKTTMCIDIHISVKQNSSDIIYCVTIINLDVTSIFLLVLTKWFLKKQRFIDHSKRYPFVKVIHFLSFYRLL